MQAGSLKSLLDPKADDKNGGKDKKEDLAKSTKKSTPSKGSDEVMAELDKELLGDQEEEKKVPSNKGEQPQPSD